MLLRKDCAKDMLHGISPQGELQSKKRPLLLQEQSFSHQKGKKAKITPDPHFLPQALATPKLSTSDHNPKLETQERFFVPGMHENVRKVVKPVKSSQREGEWGKAKGYLLSNTKTQNLPPPVYSAFEEISREEWEMVVSNP